MSRIPAVDPQNAQGKQKDLLDAVEKKLGRTPNLTRVMAHAPAVLEGYLGLSGALGQGTLSAKLREQIALAVAEIHQCDYCLSAHTAIGGMVGLDQDAMRAARAAKASDPKASAALALARTLVVNRGHLTDQELAAARTAGLSDAEVLEVTANVVLNVLTNYVNHVADTVVDFPKAPALVAAS